MMTKPWLILLRFFCYSDEESGHCACASGHFPTANQREMRKEHLDAVIATLIVSIQYVIKRRNHILKEEWRIKH